MNIIQKNFNDIHNHPDVIQGGMGIAVSDWKLAKAVSEYGELGVVSGTSINSVLIRRLQDGDPQGHSRRALSFFPDQQVAKNLVEKYFVEGGIKPDQTYKRSPLFQIESSVELLQLTVAANFVEVFLAKEGHQGVVGINFLEKVQLPHLPSLYGALLAGVDYVLMGAGIPREIPGALDALSQHLPFNLKLYVEGGSAEDDVRVHFDPKKVLTIDFSKPLKRPFMLPIVASASLALTLAKKANGKVDGFIIEHWTAGGHNAPPRGQLKVSEAGEPIYGDKDIVDMAKFRELGLPFWLAGSTATPEKYLEAKSFGAHGVQIGTAFAFCNESGLDSTQKDHLRKKIFNGESVTVFTDPVASPSGFPFKVAKVEGTLFESTIYEARPRKCDLGYLRNVYKGKDGRIGLRCSAEPVNTYLKKDGKIEDTVGKKCLCNGLFSAIGQGQRQENGYKEAIIFTAGDDLANLNRFFKKDSYQYSASDVIDYLKYPDRVASAGLAVRNVFRGEKILKHDRITPNSITEN